MLSAKTLDGGTMVVDENQITEAAEGGRTAVAATRTRTRTRTNLETILLN